MLDFETTPFNEAANGLVEEYPLITPDAVVLKYDGAEYYYIEWSRLRTPTHLVAWANQLATKSWMTGLRLKCLLEAVARHKGWDLSLPS